MKTPAAIEIVVKNLSDNFSLKLSQEQGANGYIYFGRNLILGKDIVLKFYYWADEKRAHTEPQAMEAIRHENILGVKHAGFGTEDWAYFVSPYMKDGTIDNILDKKVFSLIDAVKIGLGVASGLCEMHSRHILHRDLKAANIFMDGKRPVIGDFGSIIYIQNIDKSVASNTKHSLIYRPPETCEDAVFSVRGDIYQVGLVLYQLCGGYFPYVESDWLNEKEYNEYAALKAPDNQLLATNYIEKRIKSGRIIDLKTLQPYTPKSLRKIIKKCCEVNPQDRFETASQLLIALTNLLPNLHNWTCDGNAYRLHTKQAEYSIRPSKDRMIILKRKLKGKWLQQHKLGQIAGLMDAISAVEKSL